MAQEGNGEFLAEEATLRWLERVNADPAFLMASRWTDVIFELRCENAGHRFAISQGAMTKVEADDARAERIVMHGSTRAWSDYLQSVPSPPNHHVLAMAKLRDDFEIASGHELLVQNLHVLGLALELLREPPQTEAAPMTGLEPIVGRYLSIEVQGHSQRIYVEESGQGTPVLCLHTAGADSRQYRRLQTDPEVLRDFRVIAFDLPWHGKSLPPDEWWRSEYLLTKDLYVDTVMAFTRAFGLELPLVVGCSMAGSLVLELARAHADEVGGVLGFSGAAKVEGRFHDWPLKPTINSNQSVPAWTYALMAPQSPAAAKAEVWWMYSQGGSGVYRGDTYFYSQGLDLRGMESEIDTSVCPVYLYTGEYDFACTPENTEDTIRRIPGARGGRMPGLGHFPMAENYGLCKTYLLPALKSLRDAREERLSGP